MDATPVSLGQELSGYASQIEHGIRAIENSMSHLSELALGGTAVGTGLNTPKGYIEIVAQEIARISGYPFISAPNKFEAMAAQLADSYLEAVNLGASERNRLVGSGNGLKLNTVLRESLESEFGMSLELGKLDEEAAVGAALCAAVADGSYTSISEASRDFAR